MELVRCIQHVEPFPSDPASAALAVEFCRSQVDFLGGRVIGDDRTKPTAAQLFYSADGVPDGAILPDGSRIVLCPDTLLAALDRAITTD